MKTYGIIGHPLGHTMSPTLHNWGFKTHGIDAEYLAWPTAPEELPAFMENFRKDQIGGLSITIPHKQAVIPFLDRVTERAERVGAVNTLYWEDDRLMGENTDVLGIVEPVRSRHLSPKEALVLGAGGAARAAVAACLELGIERVLLANRTLEKAQAISNDFNPFMNIQVVEWTARHEYAPQLLINTTPLGMQGQLEQLNPWEGSLGNIATVFDLVYNPLDTVLLQKSAEAGSETIQGLDMFLHQGLAQFRLWTGKELEFAGAHALIRKALGC